MKTCETCRHFRVFKHSDGSTGLFAPWGGVGRVFGKCRSDSKLMVNPDLVHPDFGCNQWEAKEKESGE